VLLTAARSSNTINIAVVGGAGRLLAQVPLPAQSVANNALMHVSPLAVVSPYKQLMDSLIAIANDRHGSIPTNYVYQQRLQYVSRRQFLLRHPPSRSTFWSLSLPTSHTAHL
jgi:hypothetical protein